MDFHFKNGTALLSGTLAKADVCVSNGVFARQASSSIDVTGYFILPGIIDLHGDGFERQIAPRPKAMFSQSKALRHIDLELASCGVTVAWLAHSWSWEGMKRSPERAQKFVATLSGYLEHSMTDLRVQLRCETHTCDRYTELMATIEQFGIDYVVFNNHLPEAKEMFDKADGSFAAWATDVGRSVEDHVFAYQNAMALSEQVEEFLQKTSRDFQRKGIKFGSHDDRDSATRQKFSKLGAKIAEFPTTVEAAKAARDLGDPILMGAPNVVRGGSQSGNIAAIDLVKLGLCDVLVSDYYYPSLSQAAFKLWQDDICSLPKAWAMISENPASVMGLTGIGHIELGARADLVFVNTETLQIDATLCRGRFSFITGEMIDRLISAQMHDLISAAE